MGFRLGAALGKLAGGIIRQATGGVIRPNFQRPSIVPTVPDSVVSRTGGLAGLIGGDRTTSYYTQPGQIKSLNGGGASMDGAGCPVGFRLNKTAYVTRGGGTSRWPVGLQLHDKKSTCVKRRKINAGNGRAATRAVRRLVSFYRLSQRVAKQLRRAASAAHIRGGRSRKALSAGRGSVEVVNVE